MSKWTDEQAISEVQRLAPGPCEHVHDCCDFARIGRVLLDAKERADAATRRIAELEAALHEYGEHDGRCVLARFTAGRPMPGGGYEMEYDRVWYEPVDRRPPCTCGFSAALAGSTALRDFVRPLLVESAREAANDTGYEDRVNEDDVADRILKEAGL